MNSQTKLGVAWILLYFWVLVILTGLSLVLSLDFEVEDKIIILVVGSVTGIVSLFWSLNAICGDHGKK